ncbi:hypothetical protein MSG28_010650 [Choristoneura fumiferana]|uniref:Uncharacterized protein n=1 Tax=Choristoneura fumiferana TaxID=7141 RepID=A0ACC0KNA3_CHOFU|nr:hypothetical protein MSG28_010650 [Choristoneura fumiferana]
MFINVVYKDAPELSTSILRRSSSEMDLSLEKTLLVNPNCPVNTFSLSELGYELVDMSAKGDNRERERSRRQCEQPANRLNAKKPRTPNGCMTK